MTDTATITTLTFENGYERLQRIAARLNQEDVPVSEMCDLFAEGKGLEQALTDYLDTQRARVEAIHNGDGMQTFAIEGQAAASTPQEGQSSATNSSVEESRDLPVDTADFVPTPPGRTGVADDDIPF